MAEHANVSVLIANVVSLRMATLHELATVYSIEDCYDMIEIAVVDGHNRRILSKEK